MKKIAIGFAAFLLFVVGALYALTFVDVNAYREDVSALVKEQTGRTLELRGPLEVGFSLSPTIVAKDVLFGNAAWGSKPHMLEAEEVGITLSLLGLITGDMSISRVTAINSSLLLEANASGAMNWEIETGTPSDDMEASATTPVSLPDLSLINTKIVYKSQRIDQTFRANLSSLSVVEGLSGTVIEAAGTFDGLPIGFEGSFSGSPR